MEKEEKKIFEWDQTEPLPYMNGFRFRTFGRVGTLITRKAVYAKNGELVMEEGLFIEWDK